MERNKDQIYGQDLLMHTYTWYLPSLSGYDPNDPQGPSDPNTYFTLTVRVSDRSEPLSWMVNRVTADSDQWDGAYAEECTPICGWGGEIIYTDQNAPGYVQNGTSWAYAYRDLQRALARAARGGGSQIRIADGVYRPGDHPEDTFLIPAGVSVAGGYAGYGADDPDQQDWKKYKTILSGYIGKDEYGFDRRNETVVTIGDNSLLERVIVEEGNWEGIDGGGVSSTVKNCLLKNNIQRGIDCENGNLNIHWCEIYKNGYQGVYHAGGNYSLVVENCKIYDNLWDGIYVASSTSTILNSLVYQNGSDSNYFYTYYGIHLINPGVNTEIRNNTIVHNTKEGISRSGGSAPTVKNNIIYFNNEEGTQLVNISPTYCCIQNWSGGTGNINVNPQFVYDQPPYGYYHIKYESPCRNGGDYGSYPDETDMDNQPRMQENRIDIGTDEVSCTNTRHENDWTYDGVINYGDYAILSRAWLSCDPNTYPPPKDPEDEYIWYVMRWGFMADMNQDSCVDLADLILFCDPDNWLWTACWREDYMDAWGMKDVAGEGMLTSTIVMAESFCSTQPLRAESVRLDYESTPAELAQNITDILGFLDTVLEKDNPENKEGILEIKAVLEGWLKEVEL